MAIVRHTHSVQRIDDSVLPHEKWLSVFGKNIMLAKDGPQYGCYRALVADAYLLKAVAAMEEKWFVLVVNKLIDKFFKLVKADLVKKFAFSFPAQIIRVKFGLPREDYPKFQK